MEEQLVVFELSDERYGVDIASVDSIIRLQPVVGVPHAPTFVEGVTRLRGTVLPVIDLRKRFGLPAQEPTKETRIVVAGMGGLAVGMLVDAVIEVRKVPGEDIEPPSPLVVTVGSAFISGIAKVDDEHMIIVLDLELVLSPEEQADLHDLRALPEESAPGLGEGEAAQVKALAEAGR
jgi:purine-binding chemotaxis protein CheW